MKLLKRRQYYDTKKEKERERERKQLRCKKFYIHVKNAKQHESSVFISFLFYY